MTTEQIADIARAQAVCDVHRRPTLAGGMVIAPTIACGYHYAAVYAAAYREWLYDPRRTRAQEVLS